MGSSGPLLAYFFGIVEPENMVIPENDSETRPESVTLPPRGDLPAVENLQFM